MNDTLDYSFGDGAGEGEEMVLKLLGAVGAPVQGRDVLQWRD